ncbi:uncharacterized protein G2W53_007542 [Senna tora]|uniref:Uncharacterized protein n=1 Tax=Senna tora TaxID=362788 RepID=A0A834X6Y9_9FABA|nr:uncharacterized protein G2W53_007542 [Senna tora]
MEEEIEAGIVGGEESRRGIFGETHVVTPLFGLVEIGHHEIHESIGLRFGEIDLRWTQKSSHEKSGDWDDSSFGFERRPRFYSADFASLLRRLLGHHTKELRLPLDTSNDSMLNFTCDSV